MIALCAALLALLQTAPLPYHDSFAALGPAWRVAGGSARVLPQPDAPDARMLELASGATVILQGAGPMRDVAMEARVRFAERRGWVEAPFLVRASEDGRQAVQAYLEQTGNQAMAVRLGGTTAGLGSQESPVPLELGRWYAVKVVAAGPRLGVWVDGKLALTVRDDQPREGFVGLRVGDAVTDYADLVVRQPTAEEAKEVTVSTNDEEQPKPTMQSLALTLPSAGRATLRYPDIAEPGVPFDVTVDTADTGGYALAFDGRTYPVRSGVPIRLALSGPEGPRELVVRRNGQVVGQAATRLRAATTFEAGAYTDLFTLLRSTVAGDRSAHRYRGTVVHCNPTWVRDHVHEMKAYQYWERDLSSFVDTLISLQHPDGFFYEILTAPTDGHLTFVKPKHRLVDEADNIGWVRLEIEADVEYLMVEGAYHIWQATGDLEAMKARLPHLERGLDYCFTDPTRWDSEHGALKRAFTIDTWDFTYGTTDRNRRIEADTPMGIMHGDNSGLYRACLQLATMMRAAGETDKAKAWETRAAALRERVNRLCFNGTFYTHQILLQPVDTGVKEQEILSLSNPYDINRGLPTHAMAVKILDEYRRRRTERAATHFSEWFSVDPPYPQFGPYAAGSYIDGGMGSFVAGELAKAALHEGREEYGADILRRVAAKVAADKAIYFLYTVDGKNQGGGPSGWGAAAVMSALLEGLAGIVDETKLFEKVTISPRFASAGIDHARVCSRYGPSGAYVALQYDHQPADHIIRLRLSGVAKDTTVRLLLPAGARSSRLVGAGAPGSRVERLEQSRYLVFRAPAPLNQGVFEVAARYAQ